MAHDLLDTSMASNGRIRGTDGIAELCCDGSTTTFGGTCVFARRRAKLAQAFYTLFGRVPFAGVVPFDVDQGMTLT